MNTLKLNLTVFTIDRRCYPSVTNGVSDSQRSKINQIYLASYIQIVTRSVSQNYARLFPDARFRNSSVYIFRHLYSLFVEEGLYYDGIQNLASFYIHIEALFNLKFP